VVKKVNNIKPRTLNLILSIAVMASSGLLYAGAPGVNVKFEKWQIPSYFRGYNVIYETPKTLQDFIDFGNYGGNFFSINTRGFFREDAPYEINDTNIAGADSLVGFCRLAGLHYSIAVRSGPALMILILNRSGHS
jgi:hypothetical protein